jgi:metal-responsive CopG/Arc/MetJ family transcriptional regulator
MDSKTINLTIPANLLAELDEAAKANYTSRSDYIRESVVLRLKKQHVVDNSTENEPSPAGGSLFDL